MQVRSSQGFCIFPSLLFFPVPFISKLIINNIFFIAWNVSLSWRNSKINDRRNTMYPILFSQWYPRIEMANEPKWKALPISWQFYSPPWQTPSLESLSGRGWWFMLKSPSRNLPFSDLSKSESTVQINFLGVLGGCISAASPFRNP